MYRAFSCWRRPCMAALFMLAVALAVQAQNRTPAKRAKPPTFDSATTRAFAPDLFAKLVGERPANPGAVQPPPGGQPSAVAAATDAPKAGSGWSNLITAATLEDEVKAIKLACAKNLTTPTDFAGKGHKEIRRDYTVLAVLFAIIAEYDGDVRWKKDAAVARDLFARTASNAKAGGNVNVYNESKKRFDELSDLLNGSSPPGAAEQQETDWAAVADRAPLMQRLELAGDKNLSPWTSSDSSFAENVESILHEAEIVAALAETLTREGMQDADDETYAGFAERMKRQARNIVDAVRLNNADQARQAVGEISKACSECHESYR